MKEGDPFLCSHCGQTAFARISLILDGWNVCGKHLVCPFCDAEIEPLPSGDEIPSGGEPEEAASGTGAEYLRTLFGAEDPPEQKTSSELLIASMMEEEKRFCRDCAHAVVSIFSVTCTKKSRDVDPMEDCPLFQKRANS